VFPPAPRAPLLPSASSASAGATAAAAAATGPSAPAWTLSPVHDATEFRIISAYMHVLRYFDPQVAVYLADVDLDPEVYAIPFLTTLFADNLPLADTVCLWDMMFATYPDGRFPLFLAAAIVMQVRSMLLGVAHAVAYAPLAAAEAARAANGREGAPTTPTNSAGARPDPMLSVRSGPYATPSAALSAASTDSNSVFVVEVTGERLRAFSATSSLTSTGTHSRVPSQSLAPLAPPWFIRSLGTAQAGGAGPADSATGLMVLSKLKEGGVALDWHGAARLALRMWAWAPDSVGQRDAWPMESRSSMPDGARVGAASSSLSSLVAASAAGPGVAAAAATAAAAAAAPAAPLPASSTAAVSGPRAVRGSFSTVIAGAMQESMGDGAIGMLDNDGRLDRNSRLLHSRPGGAFSALPSSSTPPSTSALSLLPGGSGGALLVPVPAAGGSSYPPSSSMRRPVLLPVPEADDGGGDGDGGGSVGAARSTRASVSSAAVLAGGIGGAAGKIGSQAPLLGLGTNGPLTTPASLYAIRLAHHVNLVRLFRAFMAADAAAAGVRYISPNITSVYRDAAGACHALTALPTPLRCLLIGSAAPNLALAAMRRPDSVPVDSARLLSSPGADRTPAASTSLAVPLLGSPGGGGGGAGAGGADAAGAGVGLGLGLSPAIGSSAAGSATSMAGPALPAALAAAAATPIQRLARRLAYADMLAEVSLAAVMDTVLVGEEDVAHSLAFVMRPLLAASRAVAAAAADAAAEAAADAAAAATTAVAAAEVAESGDGGAGTGGGGREEDAQLAAAAEVAVAALTPEAVASGVGYVILDARLVSGTAHAQWAHAVIGSLLAVMVARLSRCAAVALEAVSGRVHAPSGAAGDDGWAPSPASVKHLHRLALAVVTAHIRILPLRIDTLLNMDRLPERPPEALASAATARMSNSLRAVLGGMVGGGAVPPADEVDALVSTTTLRNYVSTVCDESMDRRTITHYEHLSTAIVGMRTSFPYSAAEVARSPGVPSLHRRPFIRRLTAALPALPEVAGVPVSIVVDGLSPNRVAALRDVLLRTHLPFVSILHVDVTDPVV